MELVKKKYGTYIEGYKIVEETKKRIRSFDICIYEREVGYSQYYDFSDFPVDGMDYFSKPAGVFDLFIGEPEMIGHVWGVKIIKAFCENHIDQRFEACFVDPNKDNARAIRAFEKNRFYKN